MSVDIIGVIGQTDWALLREQKAQLVDGPVGSPDYEEAVAGLLNWIDAIQDAAVDSGMVSEEEVFGVEVDN